MPRAVPLEQISVPPPGLLAGSMSSVTRTLCSGTAASSWTCTVTGNETAAVAGLGGETVKPRFTPAAAAIGAPIGRSNATKAAARAAFRAADIAGRAPAAGWLWGMETPPSSGVLGPTRLLVIGNGRTAQVIGPLGTPHRTAKGRDRMNASAADRARIGVGHVPAITDDVATFAHQLGAPYVPDLAVTLARHPGRTRVLDGRGSRGGQASLRRARPGPRGHRVQLHPRDAR